jgi:YD repeat-containing protein
MHVQAFPYRWLVTLMLAGVMVAPLSAFATEFTQAHKVFLANSYHESGEQAVQAFAEEYCKNQYVRDCSAIFTGEVWSSAYSTWNWIGTLTYQHTSSQTFYSTPISGLITYSCLLGWSAYDVINKANRCSRPDKPDVSCEQCSTQQSPQVGNPIAVNGGIKVQTEQDYRNASGTLILTRTYRSDEGRWLHNYQVSGIDYQFADFKKIPGMATICGWNTTLGKDECLAYGGKGATYSFTLRRGAGRRVDFGSSSGYQAPPDINDRVTPVLDASGTRIGTSVANAAKRTTEVFSLNGYLLSSTDANGQTTTFTYSDEATPSTLAPYAGLLLKVQDAFGQALNFIYDAQGRLAAMTDPAGGVTTYAFDTLGNLAQVTYPDGKSKTYIYNELDKTANIARTNFLTGIVDENGSRYATFAYDSAPKAISTEHAGGVEKYMLSYPSYAETLVVDPLGANYKYSYINTVGMLRSFSTRRPGAGGTGTVTAFFSYDANGNISLYTDFDGVMTS